MMRIREATVLSSRREETMRAMSYAQCGPRRYQPNGIERGDSYPSPGRIWTIGWALRTSTFWGPVRRLFREGIAGVVTAFAGLIYAW
jgi:hypothetical protein